MTTLTNSETDTTPASYRSILDEAIGGFHLGDLPRVVKLPALPVAVTKFVEQSRDEKVTLRQLAATIETDSGLTVELLKHINSVSMGLRHKTNSVSQALALLGRRQCALLLIAKGMEGAMRARQSKLINQTCFWNSSFQKALFAREVATLLKTDTDAAFAGAMIQDFLLPVVTNHYLDNYLKFVDQRDELPATLVEFEQNEFGWNHAIVAAALADQWNLPEELTCCLLYHHHGLEVLHHEQLRRSPVAAVAISGLLPDQLRQHLTGLSELHHLQTQWDAFDVMALAEKVDLMQEENNLGVRNEGPLAKRCLPILKYDQSLE